MKLACLFHRKQKSQPFLQCRLQLGWRLDFQQLMVHTPIVDYVHRLLIIYCLYNVHTHMHAQTHTHNLRSLTTNSLEELAIISDGRPREAAQSPDSMSPLKTTKVWAVLFTTVNCTHKTTWERQTKCQTGKLYICNAHYNNIIIYHLVILHTYWPARMHLWIFCQRQKQKCICLLLLWL